ncbi:hypothetical protein [Thioclava electrotropha]|uniref:Uncharacterized protein n=1 Tax=Thioclava electrotropha TaxID=1549850 RepID=A0ABX6YW05_9RHOB|nr:hypothetical protein [Thioclava electrotropha]QPZ92049.1 hypothetical protein AKL02_014920 [Thioclava electrotropha]
MRNTYLQMPLEDLFTEILLETRQISDGLGHTDIFPTAAERACHLRDLAMLSGRKWIDTDAVRTLEPLIRRLDEELDDETIAIVQVFHGHNDPEHGAVGSVEARRDLTEKGKTILSLLQSFRRLRCMIEIADARVNAERLVNRRLQV